MPSSGPILPQKDDPFHGQKTEIQDAMKKKLLEWFLTKERLIGWLPHLVQWLAAAMVAQNWLGEGQVNDWVANGIAVGAVLLSFRTGGKQTFWDFAAAAGRQALSMIAAVAAFKGWLKADQAVLIVDAILSFIPAAVVVPVAGLGAVAWSAVSKDKIEHIERRKMRTKNIVIKKAA